MTESFIRNSLVRNFQKFTQKIPEKNKELFILFRMDLLGAGNRWLGAKNSPPPHLLEICYAYPTMMKLIPKLIPQLYLN